MNPDGVEKTMKMVVDTLKARGYHTSQPLHGFSVGLEIHVYKGDSWMGDINVHDHAISYTPKEQFQGMARTDSVSVGCMMCNACGKRCASYV